MRTRALTCGYPAIRGARNYDESVLTAHLGGMQTVRRAVRNVLVVVGIAVIATAGSVATSSAGVTAPTDVASIQPSPGQKVGVAMPVTVTFAQSIANRAAAERIHQRSPRPPRPRDRSRGSMTVSCNGIRRDSGPLTRTSS